MKNHHPLVSIGIPTYNRADSYFKEALESALNQDYPNLEIVVSDNCSIDGTQEHIEEINDPRITYYKQTQQISVNDNFNFCLHFSKGEYFLLLHDDDLIDFDFLTSCFSSHPFTEEVGFIRTGVRIIDAEGYTLSNVESKAQGLTPEEFFLAWYGYLKIPVPIYFCNTLFNTKRLKEIGGFKSKTNLYQDVVCIAKLINDYEHHDIQKIKSSFRRHGIETYGTKSKITDWCEDSLYLIDVICENVKGNEDLLRDEGKKYLNKKCYNKASKTKNLICLLKLYYVIYKKFGYSYSPLNNIYLKAINKFHKKIRNLR